MFDILSDSALDIARGLLDEAWGGKSPDGGLDFPSACVLSRASEAGSDVHMELGVVSDTESLSAIPWLADVTHTEVQGPSDSDAPFRYQSGELVPPGMFGKALRSYGQVMALAGEYGVPTAGYDSWFREQWGVDGDADLSLAIPMVRSHGDALWGGINRKLSPYASAHSAASKQIRVTWHGRSRKDIGEHSVVAWPRLNAIAQIAGGALLVEDRRARARLKRIDFRIVRAEIPQAPKHLGSGLGHIPVRQSWELRSISRGAIEFIQGFRATALVLARGGLGEALSVDPAVEVPSATILKYLQEQAVPGIPHVNFLEMGDPVFDLVPPPVKPALTVDKGPEMNVYNVFAAVTRPYIDKHYDKLPTARTLRLAMDAVREVPNSDANLKVVREVVATAVPDDFLLRMYRLYTVMHRDPEKGEEIVSTALKTFDAPRSVFETRDWVAVGRRVKNSAKCRGWFVEEIARGISRHVREHGQQSPVIGRLRRILSAEGTGDVAVAEVVRQRRNWWANEYRKRSRDRPARRVEYQIRSKLFRVTRVDINARGKVDVAQTSPALVGALESVARAYLRKRKGKGAPDPTAPDPGRMSLFAYALHLDGLLAPAYSFTEGVKQYRRSAMMLEDDVLEIVQFLAMNMPETSRVAGMDFSETIEDADEPDDEDHDGIECPLTEGPAPEPVADESGGDGGDLFGVDDEDDDDDAAEVGPMAGMVKLSEELADDYPALDLRDIAAAVGQHGEYVHASAYAAIGEEAHRAYLVRVSAPSKEVDTDDIRDARRYGVGRH